MSRPPFGLERHDLGCAGRDKAAIAVAPLAAEDADRLGTVFAAMDPWASYPYPASGLAAYFAKSEPSAPRFAILCVDELAGVAGLRLDWLRGPYIQFLGILAPHQGTGLGAAVLDWIEREARASGARNLWVAASDFNGGALRFYERSGFARVAVLDGLVRDGRDEILLRKRLSET